MSVALNMTAAVAALVFLWAWLSAIMDGAGSYEEEQDRGPHPPVGRRGTKTVGATRRRR